jgi:hypothetical protein
MNFDNTIKLIVILFVMAYSIVTNAQSGITIYTGLSYAVSPDKIMTPSGTSHSGYLAGLTARLNDDPMYFLFTGEYGVFNLTASEKVGFINGKDLSYTKGKFGLGFDLAKLGKNITLRSKFQGNILVIYKVSQDIVPIDSPVNNRYVKLNEAIAGLSSGVGITYKHLDIDFEYEHGLYNIYYSKKQTTMNFFNLTVGVRF